MGIVGKWPPGKMSTKANGHCEIGANEHFGANGYMGQMGIEGKWVLGQMGIWGKGQFGAKGRSGTNEHWDTWTFGKTGSLEQMG